MLTGMRMFWIVMAGALIYPTFNLSANAQQCNVHDQWRNGHDIDARIHIDGLGVWRTMFVPYFRTYENGDGTATLENRILFDAGGISSMIRSRIDNDVPPVLDSHAPIGRFRLTSREGGTTYLEGGRISFPILTQIQLVERGESLIEFDVRTDITLFSGYNDGDILIGPENIDVQRTSGIRVLGHDLGFVSTILGTYLTESIIAGAIIGNHLNDIVRSSIDRELSQIDLGLSPVSFSLLSICPQEFQSECERLLDNEFLPLVGVGFDSWRHPEDDSPSRAWLVFRFLSSPIPNMEMAACTRDTLRIASEYIKSQVGDRVVEITEF